MASQAMPATLRSDAPAPLPPAGIAEGVFCARLHFGLAAVKPLWLRLEAEGLCTPHQSYAWAEGIARHLLPQGAEALVVEVTDRRSGEPVMLLPLMRRPALGHRMIEWLSCGVADYSAPLLAGARDWTREDAEAAWAAILSALPPADRLHITGMPQQVQGVANPLALLSIARDSGQITSGLAIGGDPETLIKRVCRPSFAKTFHKHCRRFEQLGAFGLVEADTPALVGEHFEKLLELRLKRFRELGRFDLLTQQPAVDFYREAALRGLSDGSVRLFGLRAGDAWIASIYVLAGKGSLHALLLGIDDAAVHNVSPGLTMIGKLMMWGCANGFAYFDLSVGSQYYKEHIGAGSESLSEICQSMTLRGGAAETAIKYRGRGEALVRSNPRLFKAAQEAMQRWRRLRAAR